MTNNSTNLNDFTDFKKAYWNDWSAHDGSVLVSTGDNEYYLHHPKHYGTIVKTITLEAGKLYEFNFSYNNTGFIPGDGTDIILSIGTEQLIRQNLPDTSNKWLEFEGLFKPKDSATNKTLSFRTTYVYDIDNIRIRLVPENELAAKMKKFDMQNSPKVV